MGDAAGEAAERFHLLRVPQLLLEPAAIGDVERDTEQVRPAAEGDPLRREQHRRQRAIARAHVPFDGRAALLEHVAHPRHEERPLVDGDEVEQVQARHLVGAVVGEALQRGVPAHHRAVLVGQRDEPGQALEQRLRERALLA